MLTRNEFDLLSGWAFAEENRGYKPAVIEAPNGDGVWDEAKLYAHINRGYGMPEDVSAIFDRCIDAANDACRFLGLPSAGYDSTIRVLHYPPEATSAPHTDFDMFTLSLFRTQSAPFKYLGGSCLQLDVAKSHYPGIHFGELITEIKGWPATKHAVVSTGEVQRSAVLFVMPPADYVLPSGKTSGQWVSERKARSRKSS